jgi:hypothetical protein
MKNTELLRVPNYKVLSSIDRQKRFILATLIEPKPCPNCTRQIDYFEGAGIDVDSLDLITSTADELCSCPACKRELERVVPLIGEPWRWRLVPVEVDP